MNIVFDISWQVEVEDGFDMADIDTTAGDVGCLLPLAYMYAIVRHQIFDIRIIVRRGVVYFLLTATLALLYFGLIMGLGPRLDPREGHPGVAFLSLGLIALLFTHHALADAVGAPLGIGPLRGCGAAEPAKEAVAQAGFADSHGGCPWPG